MTETHFAQGSKARTISRAWKISFRASRIVGRFTWAILRRTRRSHWYGGFFQDDWRIKPRVTLNLGLRYEYYTSPVERNNYLGNFNPNVNPATTPAVEQFGPGAPLASEYKAGWGNLSPRLGVAWDVRGNGKTVIRAGGSILTAAQALGLFIDDAPFGANFPSIGVNNSGTAVNAHTPANVSFGPCTTIVSPAPCNWTLAGPVFPTAGSLRRQWRHTIRGYVRARQYWRHTLRYRWGRPQLPRASRSRVESGYPAGHHQQLDVGRGLRWQPRLLEKRT